MLTVRACAKINLTLEVLGRYPDGYHQIASVMQLINLSDTLTFEASDRLQLRCDIPQLVGDDNLVLQAARLLQEAARCRQGALISLQKGIPVNSGLGGGSSDAAATMKALNEFWKLDLPRQQLEALSAKVGSDVLFFLDGGTALVEGRGEKVTPLPSLPRHWVVLLKPPFDVPRKTPGMYNRLDSSHFTSGQFTQTLVECLEKGERFDGSLCYNAFEQVAFSFFHGLEEHQQSFLAAGAGWVRLSGSGPSLFTLVEDRATAEMICSKLKGKAYLAGTL